MKGGKKAVMTALAVILVVFMSFPTVFARAGGGGGTGGGGGGYTTGGHTSGYTRSNPISSIIGYVVMGLAASGGAVTLYIKVRAKNRKAEKIMENLSRFDPTWSLADFDRHIQNMFYTVQEAWAQRDQEIARRYLSRELFEKYQIKSQWMIMRHEQNILQNQKLLAALPVAVNDFQGEDRDYMWVYIKAKMIDYTIDDRTMEVISGSKNSASFVEYWKLIKENGCWVLDEIRQKNEFNLDNV